MNKKTKKIIIIFLVIAILGSTFGYAISSIITSKTNNQINTETETEITLTYAEKLQEVLNKAITDKNVIKEEVLNDLIKRNEASDYSLATALSILGTPICVLESYDNATVNVYSEKEEIATLLKNIADNKNYTNNSFIQLYWMKETGEAIITWIALNEEDMSEVKTVGIITSQYQDLNEMNLKQTDLTVDTFSSLDLDKTSLIEQYKPTLYKVQNKLLECNFIMNLMESEEYKHTWNEYVIKNENGYLFLNTKDDEFYLVYQTYSDNKKIPFYNETTLSNLKDGMSIEEYLTIVPKSPLYEVYLYESNTIYTSYVVRTSEEDDTLTYFDFKDGKLSLKEPTESTENISENSTETN